MYNFEFNKDKKTEILDNINFTNRQKLILLLLMDNVSRKEINIHIGCSKRTVCYEIKRISEKIWNYENKKESQIYYVYMHIFPNEKKYVGVSKNIKQRWGNYGLQYKENKEMYEDIMKYGWNNIKHEILIKTSNDFEAYNLETKLITLFDLTNNQKGYNKNIGLNKTKYNKMM